MFFDEEIQKDVIEPEDKRNKENVTEDIVVLSSEKTEIEEEDKEEEKCVPKYNITKIVPFITEMENIRRKSKKSGTMQQDFYSQEACIKT